MSGERGEKRERRERLREGLGRWISRARGWLGAAGPRSWGFESSRRMARWLPVGFAIGLVAGAGAIVFTRAISFVTGLFLQGATGFRPPGPVGEGGGAYLAATRPWLLPLVTMAGGILSGIIVFGLAPEAEGHGTDAAIEAIHRRGGWIRARIPPVKLLASAITIGTGGSAGREGGLGTGLLGLALPQVLHTGYGWVQQVMTRDGLLALSPLVLVVLPFAKILATSLSIGSGGSGGIFGPGMVVGAMLGAALWSAGQALGLPGLPAQPAPFVIVGMMALFGGIAHAPLAVMLMVAEMTGTLSLLAPAMIAVAISTAVVGDETIYRAQLRDRASVPPSGGGEHPPAERGPGRPAPRFPLPAGTEALAASREDLGRDLPGGDLPAQTAT